MRIIGIAVASVVAFALPCQAQPRAPTDRQTIEFIKALRNPDGGYAPAAVRPGNPSVSSVRATLAVLRAQTYLGGVLPTPAAAATFVMRCYDRTSGGFGDRPGGPPTVASTAVGTMAAVELGVPRSQFQAAAVNYLEAGAKSIEDIRITAAAFESLHLRSRKAGEWMRQITSSRNPDGTFGSGPDLARATGGTAAMILRLTGTLDHRAAVLRAMRAGQRPDGGFGGPNRDDSDLESTYRIMRTFAMLTGQPADAKKLRTFVARCRSATGGYGVRPGEPSTAAGTYFAASVLHWLDER